VSTDRGLAVPVLRNVEKMSFAKVESEIKRLAAATRDGKLSLQELSGGTFTITNGGIFGSLLSTPILNPPQSGILGMHAIQKRPVVVNDQVVIRPMMYVALSYDHRLVDGRESVSFLVRVKELLEDPARLMLEI
jgi:2-oxoglutarate dehydrogenase E2 component (dihydrolipoamide succinyltransferase)